MTQDHAKLNPIQTHFFFYSLPAMHNSLSTMHNLLFMSK